MMYVYVALVVTILIAGCSSSEPVGGTTNPAPETVATTSAATTTTLAPTTTTVARDTRCADATDEFTAVFAAILDRIELDPEAVLAATDDPSEKLAEVLQ